MTDRLENLTINPESTGRAAVTSDLLSHVLAQIRLTGDHVYSNTLSAGADLDLEAGAAHLFVVTEGQLHIAAGSQAPSLVGTQVPMVVDTADLVMLPRGPGDLRITAPGEGAVVAVCRFWFDPDSLRGMIFVLPETLHIPRAAGAGWLEGLVHFMLIETQDVQPGAALMISRLIDLAVIRALRTWVQQGRSSGWLGGLSDPRIARALKAIHEQPMERWSIGSLAGIAGMSRSSFCDRFTTLVGRAPLRYRNEWRLAIARDLLARRNARVGEVGLSVGYTSEAAFSRAYKECFGHSPRAEYSGRSL